MPVEESRLRTSFAADVAAVSLIDAVPKILEVVCRTTGMGFSAVARVTDGRWIACAVRDEIAFGLEPGGELDVKTTLCDEVRSSRSVIAIDHVAEDDRYCDHHTPRMYGLQSYISVPLRLPDGEFFGTLCAIHSAPARVNNPETIHTFELFADLIGFHLSVHDRLAVSERALLDERQRAQLRDQFIAVLGHDLRNPLAAIHAGGKLLGMLPLDEKGRRIATVIQSSATRMAGLIENVLDFARGQLGDGVPVTLESHDNLAVTLEQIVSELRTAWPDRDIRTHLALEHPVTCDRARVAQLFSNLLANALTHGDPAGPVRVAASTSEHGFELTVANTGAPIPPDTMERLFQPFSRSSTHPGQQGLGLGLYIATEIARAHRGTLSASSSDEETRFTFRIPPQPSSSLSA